MIHRVEMDWVATTPKMRKPWNIKDLETWLALFVIFYLYVGRLATYKLSHGPSVIFRDSTSTSMRWIPGVLGALPDLGTFEVSRYFLG